MKNFRAIGRMSVVAAATALVATSVPTFAAPRDPPVKQQPTKVDSKQKYCVKDVITGSRLPRKICKTRAEWITEDGFDPTSQR